MSRPAEGPGLEGGVENIAADTPSHLPLPCSTRPRYCLTRQLRARQVLSHLAWMEGEMQTAAATMKIMISRSQVSSSLRSTSRLIMQISSEPHQNVMSQARPAPVPGKYWGRNLTGTSLSLVPVDGRVSTIGSPPSETSRLRCVTDLMSPGRVAKSKGSNNVDGGEEGAEEVSDPQRR